MSARAVLYSLRVLVKPSILGRSSESLLVLAAIFTANSSAESVSRLLAGRSTSLPGPRGSLSTSQTHVARLFTVPTSVNKNGLILHWAHRHSVTHWRELQAAVKSVSETLDDSKSSCISPTVPYVVQHVP